MEKRILSMDMEAARQSITKIAAEHGVTEEEVRADIVKAIRAGMTDPNPAVQAQWRSAPWNGREPTPEEFIAWLSSQIRGGNTFGR